MTHLASTTQGKTNDARCKPQLMPNDTALYIDGIGNWFIAFTWTIWRFLRAYAGLLYVGSMKVEFPCQEARSKNTEVGMCLQCSSAHIVKRSRSLPFDVVWIFWLWLQWLPQFWFKRNHKKGRGDLNRKASQVPGNCDKKERGWQSSWVGFWCLPELDRDMILPLCTLYRNLVLGANAQRFFWPWYTVVVWTYRLPASNHIVLKLPNPVSSWRNIYITNDFCGIIIYQSSVNSTCSQVNFLVATNS